MTCREYRQALERGDRAPALKAHESACGVCRRLGGLHAALAAAGGECRRLDLPADKVRGTRLAVARLIEERACRGPARRRFTAPWRVAAAAGLLAAAGVGVWVASDGAGPAERPVAASTAGAAPRGAALPAPTEDDFARQHESVTANLRGFQRRYFSVERTSLFEERRERLVSGISRVTAVLERELGDGMEPPSGAAPSVPAGGASPDAGDPAAKPAGSGASFTAGERMA